MPRDASDLLHGTLDVLVLKTLSWGPKHGYAVAEWIHETTKGELENKLHELVCSGQVSLAEAQRAVTGDWTSAYAKYAGLTVSYPVPTEPVATQPAPVYAQPTPAYSEPAPAYVPPAGTTDQTYTNVDGNQIPVPQYAPAAPPGATAQCGDGTYSFSQHHSGTCSHHGGVSQWL